MRAWLHRYWTLLFLSGIPVALAFHYAAPDRASAVFFASVVAILPLAAYIGRATEVLAQRLGGGIGGLLNATFGNAAELIIGAVALRRGLTDLVKASLTGSIIGNVLLVFGLCAVVGGTRYRVQHFNRTAAGIGTTMLLLSAIGLTVPDVFHMLARAQGSTQDLKLDTAIAVVLLITYCASLVFTLKTHRGLYSSDADDDSEAMDLLFTVFEVVAVGLAVLTIAMIAHDGETNWMEGVQLLAVYAILVLGFYFLPAKG